MGCGIKAGEGIRGSSLSLKRTLTERSTTSFYRDKGKQKWQMAGLFIGDIGQMPSGGKR